LEFKDFIKNRRLEIGKTLEEVGNHVGVSKTTVQRWESGNISNLRRDKIAKLAEALDVSPACLMGWEDIPTCPHYVNIVELYGEDLPSSIILKKHEEEFLNNYRLLNDQGQEFMRQTMVAALNTYKKDFRLSDMEIANEIG
jgi:transcriptional regulator with XRE-family HTH domain